MPDFHGGLDQEKQIIEDNDKRNFNLDVLGGFFDYVPKHGEWIIPTLSVKNQLQVNSCVPSATAVQKETDEGVVLSPGDLGSYLTYKGEMGPSGATLQGAMKALIDRGIAEEAVVPTRNTTFGEFSSPSNLTPEGKENAALHKNQSFWTTRSLNTVLEQLDNGRIGLTGLPWKETYTLTLLRPDSYPSSFGHAVVVIGYKLNHNGHKVLVFQNSWGLEYGDMGRFYVRFDEFNQIITFNQYFVLDIPKDTASWLSLNASRAIKEKNGPKCYAIVGNEKRWIVNEALLFMSGYTLKDIVEDKENVLPLIREGEPITLADIPEQEQNVWREAVRLMPTEQIRKVFESTLNP